MDESELNQLQSKVAQLAKDRPGLLGMAILAMLGGGISNYGISYIEPTTAAAATATAERRAEAASRSAGDLSLGKDIEHLTSDIEALESMLKDSEQRCTQGIEWCKQQIWKSIIRDSRKDDP